WTHAAIGDADRLELRLARNHLVGWIPARPFTLVGYMPASTRPRKPVPADADPVTNGPTAGSDVVKIAVRRIDDHGADLFISGIIDFCPPPFGIELGNVDLRDRETLIRHGVVHRRRRQRRR